MVYLATLSAAQGTQCRMIRGSAYYGFLRAWRKAVTCHNSCYYRGVFIYIYICICVFLKLNISGHMLIWTVLLVSACGTCAQNLSAPLSYFLYITAERFEIRQFLITITTCCQTLTRCKNVSYVVGHELAVFVSGSCLSCEY
jgi:hypothetical protein